MIRLRNLFGMMLAASAVAAAPAAENAPLENQLLVKLRVCQGDPLGSVAEGTLKVIAAPQVVTCEQRPFSLVVGGEVAVPEFHADKETVFVGLQVDGKPGLAIDGKVPLDLTLANTTADRGDKDEPRFKTDKVRTFMKLTLGETKRFRIRKEGDRDTWLEIAVEKFVPRASPPSQTVESAPLRRS